MLRKTDPDIIKGYLEDSSNFEGAHAEGLYLPESEAEIFEALAECAAKHTPLTVSAGQTGTTGGCLPFGGWLLSTEKLNKIIDVNPERKLAIVQPGVTLEELDKAVAKEGFLYPPDPTEKTATLGGNVATNASGGRSYRYGSTRNWIRRLKIVLPNGTSYNLRRGLMMANDQDEIVMPHYALRVPRYVMPSIKNSAGYFSQPGMDLVDLFIGSEGTLGIVSEIEVALAPALRETFDIVAFFPSEELAFDFVQASKGKNDSTINFYEYFDPNTLEMLRPAYPHIPAGSKAAVYIEQEINETNAKVYLDDWAALLEKHQASLDTCWLGIDVKQKKELADFRHAIPEHINKIFKQHRQIKLATDIAVPGDKFREMFNFYNSQLTAHSSQLFYIKFGHIGDNHLHVNLVAKKPEYFDLASSLVLKFIRKAVALGGTVSAEHGIGKIKHQYLQEMYGDAGLNEMRRVKALFDPQQILNRGNIFPRVP